MSPLSGFLAFLVLTLALLGCTVATGLRARRKLHILSVGGALCALAGAVYYALELGRVFDLESAGWITPVHLWMAKIATAAYLLPIATGLRTIFVPKTRALHRKLAFFVLALTVLTAITGTWMLLASKPR